jgi:hypothetical protein
MIVTIDVKNNGVHDYAKVNIQDVQVRDLELVNKLLTVVDNYNDLEIKNA